MTLPEKLEQFLKAKDWYSKGVLTADMEWRHDRGKNYGVRYLPETVGRALRHLEEARIIAVKDDGLSVQYKWIPPHFRRQYIPSAFRSDKRLLFKRE